MLMLCGWLLKKVVWFWRGLMLVNCGFFCSHGHQLVVEVWVGGPFVVWGVNMPDALAHHLCNIDGQSASMPSMPYYKLKPNAKQVFVVWRLMTQDEGFIVVNQQDLAQCWRISMLHSHQP